MNIVHFIGHITYICTYYNNRNIMIDKSLKNKEAREYVLGYNPFSYSVVVPVRRVSTGKYVKDADGDSMPLYKDLDTEQNVKVFKGDGNKQVICNLSSKAKDLFLWILFEVKTGIDYIKFDNASYMEDLGINSRTTVSQAMNELCRYSFICKTPIAGYYWINPMFFFSGDRTLKYKSRCKLV